MRKIMSFILVYLLLFSTTVTAKNYKFDNNVFGVPGTSSDLFIRHQDGGYLRKTFNGPWLSSEDGINEKKFGSGSGGGAQNFFENGDAESGTVNWNDVGAATLTTFSSSPINGTKSFRWDATAQNDIVRTDEIIIPEKFKGQACQIEFFYTGGTDDLVKPEVTDSSNVKLVGATYRNQLAVPTDFLQAQTGIVQRSIFFICPSSGNIKFQFNQTEVGNPASMDYDDVHIGELKGLSQAVLPDVAAAIVTDTGVVTSESSDFLDGNCTDPGSGTTACTFISGKYSVIPSCVCSSKSELINCSTKNVTTSGLDIRTHIASTGAGSDDFVRLICTNQGADAQQSVQVFTSVPKISENVNYITGNYDSSLQIQNMVPESFGGAVVKSGTSDNIKTITISAGVFTVAPHCVISGEIQSDSSIYFRANSTSTSLEFRNLNAGSDIVADNNFTFVCYKSPVDFKMPVVQIILVNQVDTSIASGLRINSCTVLNPSGTPTFGSSGCAAWIDSFTDNGVGDIDLNLITGVYSEIESCQMTSKGTNGCLSSGNALITNSLIKTVMKTCTTSDNFDESFYITCTGKR